MRFKLFSALLLLACFLLLGVMTGAVPVTGWQEAAAAMAESLPTAGQADPLSRSETPAPSATPAAAPVLPPSVPPSALPESTPVPATEPPAAPAADQADYWTPDIPVVSTTITADSPLKNETGYEVDADALLARAPALSLPAEGYQILIIHTHGTEAYTPDGEDRYAAAGEWRTRDPDQSVIRVGQALADALESHGLRVLHDTGIYDDPSYNGSYARSGAAIEQYLAEYPGIAMVIDLHRDAFGDEEHTYKAVSQEGAAQIMFVMGSEGSLSYPGWRENLALAMSLQGLAARQHPTLMRPTVLCQYRYNQQLTAGSLLMEVGAAGNTLQEAIEAVELFADAVGPALAARAGA